jgi:hypothetical protein
VPDRSRVNDRAASSSPLRNLLTEQPPVPDHVAVAQDAVLHRSTLAPELDRTDADQVVGRFHYATLFRNRPEVLATWRIASNQPLVLDHIAEQLGGSPQHVDGDAWSVTTTSVAVDILLPDPGALRLRWHRDARHSCDGQTQCQYSTHRPCVCPPTLQERRMATRQGSGCEPQVDMLFRLLQDPALGAFCFTSGSWSFAEEATEALQALCTHRRHAHARLDLLRVSYTLASGQRICCTRPTVTFLEPQLARVVPPW